MNIRDLKYLLAVAKMRHFGKAAEQCCVSQPTLSMQLKKLEDELGVQLFERNNKQVMITPIGEEIAKKAREILTGCDDLKVLAQRAQDPYMGAFRLGVIPTVGPYLLPRILKKIKQALPKLDLRIEEDKTETILRLLREGKLDAIILALPVDDEGLEVQHLYDEEFFVAMPKTHPLAKKQKVHMSDLQDQELLLLQEGHCLRDQALEACQMVNVTQKVGFGATSLETLRHLVVAGLGITLLPELAIAANKHNPSLVVRPFVQPKPVREIGMLWRKRSARSVCCEKWVELVREILLD